MEDSKIEFLKLAVIDGKSYKDIEVKLGIPRKVFAPWWEELKEEREKLSVLKRIKNIKCPGIDFYLFKDWYEKADKKCFYCGITEKEISELWEKYPGLTKRGRGRKLEIDRKKPELAYTEINNLVMSCYWCNNAKTDTFSEAEFVKIGKVIEEIWKARLNDNR